MLEIFDKFIHDIFCISHVTFTGGGGSVRGAVRGVCWGDSVLSKKPFLLTVTLYCVVGAEGSLKSN